MIVNAQQYAKSERKLKRCISHRRMLLQRLHTAADRNEAQREIDNLQRQATQITTQLKDYVALSTGRILPPDLSEISNLPDNLIRARIALGWTPQEFAKQCLVSRSQVHRWESTCYARVCLATILAVAKILNSALKQQDNDPNLLGKPLKLGCDWFDADFRQLTEN